MIKSPRIFKSEFKEQFLNFIWREWSQLGVFGTAMPENRWIIDPEPLLLLTLEIGRCDPRLFDEVMDWLLRNARWINAHRLSTLMQKDKIGDNSVVGAVAATLAQHNKSSQSNKWRTLAQRNQLEKANKSHHFFFSPNGKPIPLISNVSDKVFRHYGFLRDPIETRGMSKLVPLESPANLTFKMRALFGVNIRADTLVYLMTHDSNNPSRIAHLLGYSQKQLQDVLVEMATSGAIGVRTVGREKHYWLRSQDWLSWFPGYSPSLFKWIDWRALTRGLIILWRAIFVLNEDHVDEYLISSEMREAMLAAKNDLYASGIAFNIRDDRAFLGEDYMPAFLEDLKEILAICTGSL